MAKNKSKSKSELISPAEYARRRGLNKSTISRQIAAGQILLVNGKINPVAADAARAENLKTRKSDPAEVAAGNTTAKPETETYLEASARKESALADLRQMEARKMKGAL